MSRLHENVLITELTELWLFTVALTMFVLIACYSDVYALDPGQPATNNQLVLFFYFLLVLRCEFVKRIILIAANWIILVDTFGLLPAWLYAMVLFLSITVGVLSEQLNGSNWFWALEASLGLSYMLLEWNSGISENEGTSLWNFVPNFAVGRFFCFFSPRHFNCHKCCQLNLTDDHHQLITLSAHFSLWHNGHDAAHHAGSSAAAETWCYCYLGVIVITVIIIIVVVTYSRQLCC